MNENRDESKQQKRAKKNKKQPNDRRASKATHTANLMHPSMIFDKFIISAPHRAFSGWLNIHIFSFYFIFFVFFSHYIYLGIFSCCQWHGIRRINRIQCQIWAVLTGGLARYVQWVCDIHTNMAVTTPPQQREFGAASMEIVENVQEKMPCIRLNVYHHHHHNIVGWRLCGVFVYASNVSTIPSSRCTWERLRKKNMARQRASHAIALCKMGKWRDERMAEHVRSRGLLLLFSTCLHTHTNPHTHARRSALTRSHLKLMIVRKWRVRSLCLSFLLLVVASGGAGVFSPFDVEWKRLFIFRMCFSSCFVVPPFGLHDKFKSNSNLA